MNDPIVISAGALTAEISPHGAELVRLVHEDCGEVLWARDPAVWFGVSPLLFPIVGRLRDDRLIVEGKAYPMAQHGFARQMEHDVVARAAGACRFRIASDAATRAAFPFDFSLETSYRLAGDTLAIEAVVGNPGTAPLSASFGLHPAFRWPLPGAPDKSGHFLAFSDDDALAVRRLEGGLLSDAVETMPLADRRLALSDSLFARKAMILVGLRSRRLVFGAQAASHWIALSHEGLPDLGLWMVPGHDFLCIEPWHGYGDTLGFRGAFVDKPGLFHLAPGETRRFVQEIAVLGNPGAGRA